jgi:hypothetical protein
MPSGALVLTVNGVRELMVADAGVLADQYLYPIVQVWEDVFQSDNPPVIHG